MLAVAPAAASSVPSREKTTLFTHPSRLSSLTLSPRGRLHVVTLRSLPHVASSVPSVLMCSAFTVASWLSVCFMVQAFTSHIATTLPAAAANRPLLKKATAFT